MNLDKHRLTKNILVAAIMGASSVQVVVPPSLVYAANSVVANDRLPTNGHVINGSVEIKDPINNQLDINQSSQNAIITWNDFSIGANATVNFNKDTDTFNGRFNTLNYVNSGNLSQIYGTINANEGNIFIVNPAGVEIGNSAQINVGSLYVSNKNLDDALKNIGKNDIVNINDIMSKGKITNGDLMSLGNINAGKVTFDGDRIVLDVDRIRPVEKYENGDLKYDDDGKLIYEKPSYENPYGQYDSNLIEIHTTDKDKVIAGYTYEDSSIDYTAKNELKVDAEGNGGIRVFENGTEKGVSGYKWVKDYDQLQKINGELDGNFALRNSIDANNKDFNSIGDDNNKFTGNFDGLGYNIYGLTIGSDTDKKDNTGLFGVVDGATIGNVNLISGTIKGNENTGALIGKIEDSGDNGITKVENILNTAQVTGNDNVGGIIGSIGNIDNEHPEYTDGKKSVDKNVQLYGLINTGAVEGNSDVGGLVGSMNNAVLGGTSYNLADVSGIDRDNDKVSDATTYNIGGLVGNAANSTIGGVIEPDESGTLIIKENDFQIYNHLDVTGGYNIGGIVGSMENSTVQNVSNDGNVKAVGSISEEYIYHKGQIENKDEANEKINTSEQRENVQVANVGGIVGNSKNNSIISDVINEGDISTAQNTKDGDTYYIAGNVGGVVGRAEDTNITNATNKESDIRGAHNVGGIAGYFGGNATLTGGINNGGDILATSARDENGNVVKELVRGDSTSENFNIGNMGGIVGYMYGDDTHITGSANRGTVHSADIEDFDNIKESSKAANVGGIVGKIDRSQTNSLDTIKTIGKDGKEVLNTDKIAVSNSYNTGDVSGYTGIGGVVGMMYNGEVAGSYNLGAIESTRISTPDSIEPLNMGGVIGDATERANARVLIYDVYNKGQIGRDDFETYGRHVGGIVGRLSGDVEKAYNNGAIYNGFTTVGGIAGWWVDGSINNVFNTGNITVNNKSNDKDTTSEVGGIAGAVEVGTTALSNAYNLGTIRSIKAGKTNNALGGIIGNLQDFYNINTGNLVIENVYTLGNLYVDNGSINSIIGRDKFNGERTTITNAYYIAPEEGSGFTDLTSNKNNNANQTIAYENRLNLKEYAYEKDGIRHYLGEKENNTGIKDETPNNSVDESYDWRIYGGKTTPILNAFIPNTEEYLSGLTDEKLAEHNISGGTGGIQYGTAYDPLLTIIKADGTGDVSFDWQELGMSGDAGLAVYKGGLTLNNFKNIGGTGFFGGTIYTDGNLNITNVQENVDTNTDIRFGSSSKIYGSSISISADGNFEGYGDIIATGNNGSGNISLSGDNVNIYGKLQSSKIDDLTTTDINEGETSISGVEDTAHNMSDDANDIKNPNEAMVAVEERYTHKVTSKATGNINITATNGDVNIYYGNEEKGFVDTAGSLTVNAEKGNVYIDSDMKIGSDLNAKANDEIIVDISNVGKVDTTQTVHDFLHGFIGTEQGTFDLKSTINNAKITVDLWDDEEDKYDFTKYDYSEHILTSEFSNLNVSTTDNVQDIVYIWVEDGEQLKDIQQAAEDTSNTNGRGNDILGYNFALKNDINATDVDDYKSIGGNGTGYTGTFDGRGNRIIGLNTDENKDTDGDGNSLFGIIDKIDDDKIGKVTNLKVYSSNFDTNGAIAGTNNGTIDNVTGLGNHVTGTTGFVGGLVGINNGTISNSADRSSVTVGIGINSVGGLAGNNSGTNAKIENSSSNSAVSGGSATNVGGVVGSNTGTIDNADSLGITNGASNVGGIVGTNDINGSISSVYNESIIIGSGNNIGGVAGINNAKDDNLEDNKVKGLNNVANAGDIKATAENAQYIGGIIGDNNGTVDSGRNNARIEGNRYVGGIVGNNGATSDLHNITNDSSAFIVGEEYVGGIAGENKGTIKGEDIGTGEDKKEASLVNRGTITGHKWVGGVAGSNSGTITNVNSDMTLNVKEGNYTNNDKAEFFGGVVGLNDKDGIIEDATNSANINAEEADYVGGIAGQNDGHLQGAGNSNRGNVIGNSNVGGVVGLNNADIKGTNGTEQGMVGISNEGKVTAMQGGAGGIIGTNKADIEYAHLVNKGQVIGNYDTEQDPDTGEYGTGGLIGILEEGKTIKHSDLINEKNGIVTGGKNVGGLIGINKGTVEGGRTEKDGKDVGYYKYQIYNNGAIVGTDGENIGGLIGQNNGTLTAGYNTGAINITNGENVGGIVGNNTGTVDQVFNTVGGNVVEVDIMDKDDPTKVKEHYDVVEQISGATNVGGLIGTNSGTLSNAYNTSDVKGTSAGNAIGNNENGTAENIYANNPTGNLIGNGTGTVTNSYTFSENDKTNGITYIDKASQNKEGSYYFDNKTDGKTWKFYDGNSNPLLKVFLTKVTVDKDQVTNIISENGKHGIVFDGTDQSLDSYDIDAMIDNEDKPITASAPNGFEAHTNSTGGLLHGGQNHVNEGKYDDWFYSEQINTDGGDGSPNNLGYDIEFESTIAKAEITVEGNKVEHKYGNVDNINGTDYKISSIKNQNGKEIKDWKKWFSVDKGKLKDTALTGNTEGRETEDVGDNYEWNSDVTNTLEASEKDNFSNLDNLQVEGKSEVIRADLIINVNDEQILEGETPNYTGKVSGLVNGDTESILGSHQYGVENPDIEMQVGTHKGDIGIWIGNTFYKADNQGNVNLKNYTVKINPGTLTVTPIIHPKDDKRNWNNLLNDAPWDRNRDFRERKAEFNHVNGGITIEKNDEDIVVEA